MLNIREHPNETIEVSTKQANSILMSVIAQGLQAEMYLWLSRSTQTIVICARGNFRLHSSQVYSSEGGISTLDLVNSPY